MRRLRSLLVVSGLATVALVFGAAVAQAADYDFPDYITGADGLSHECFFYSWGAEVIAADGNEYLCNFAGEETIGSDHYYHWKWVDPDADTREIHRSGTNLCMDVSGGSQASGAAIVQSTCNQSNHSQWWAQEGNLLGGYGLLWNYHSGKCADLNSSSLLVLQPCNGTINSQQWSKTQYGSTWAFTNLQTGTVLSVPGGYTTLGWQLGVYTDLGVSYQRWGIDHITALVARTSGSAPAAQDTPATSPIPRSAETSPPASSGVLPTSGSAASTDSLAPTPTGSTQPSAAAGSTVTQPAQGTASAQVTTPAPTAPRPTQPNLQPTPKP